MRMPRGGGTYELQWEFRYLSVSEVWGGQRRRRGTISGRLVAMSKLAMKVGVENG